jgi:predicted nucleic acid-binding protein
MDDVLVLDASVAARILLDDQPDHDAARECYAAAVHAGLRPVAPGLYLYEMGSILSRMRTPAPRRAEALADAVALVEILHPSPSVVETALRTAFERQLTFYDAAYVALAESLDGTLWTEDREVLKRAPAHSADTEGLRAQLA